MNTPELNILIVEDEFITIETLRSDLEDLNYKVVGIAKTAEQALKILEEGSVNFAFLDIHLQGELDGIYLGGQINDRYHIPFVYLTAFGDQPTVYRAIRTEPYGYLLKPFTSQEIYAAVELAINNFKQKRLARPEDDFYAPAIAESSLNDVLFIKVDYNFHRVRIGDITHLQAGKNYIDVFTTERKFLVRSSLKDFVKKLPAKSFLQTHKSYVVNKEFVLQFDAMGVQLPGIEIPIGAAFKEDFVQAFRTV